VKGLTIGLKVQKMFWDDPVIDARHYKSVNGEPASEIDVIPYRLSSSAQQPALG